MWGARCEPAQKGAAVDTSNTAGSEELWTTGRAAAYLKDLGINRRQVSRMLDAGELEGIQLGGGKWRKVRAASVRTYREQTLRQLREKSAAHPPP